ncbi:MAG TPA: Gfo/Idh/MocA family oxidoreductase [Dehalococcoidia bacterium]|nr:Gfo/Idh/MocA family oxidoreductase [Dehalococcoidia bacterium]
MTGPLRIGVIGAGLIATRAHLPAYAACEDARVVAIASGRVDRARETAAQFGVPRIHERWQDLIADPAVDAVDICAPNHLHAEMAVAAARAGKHVLVEKPMALSLAEADAMIEAAGATGVTLMVAHNLRFVPVYRQVKRVIADGEIGRPLAARGVFMHAGPDEFWGAESDWFWDERAGGGSLLDMGVHMIDLMRWFFDEPVIEVMAMTSRILRPTPFDDNAIVLMRFAGGAIASVQSSWSARPEPDRQVTVHGEKGYVAMGRTPAEPLYAKVKEGDSVRHYVPDAPLPGLDQNPIAHFVRCVLSRETPLTSGKEGRRTLAVTLAAYQSARSGQSVKLDG